MNKLLLVLVLALSSYANDIIVKESTCTVTKTIENLRNILEKKGLTTFDIINHQKKAKSVKMEMNESKLILFGNPELSTSLMQLDMTIGLDLPMKILVYKDVKNKVQMAYRNGTWRTQEHGLKVPKRESRMNNGMDKITTQAGKCIKD